MRIKVAGARIVDPRHGVDAVQDLFIADGTILALGDTPDGFEPDEVVEADGYIAVPGLIELSARVREPGHEFKATIASESQAAIANGITTLCVPPDTDPIIDTPAVVELIVRRARDVGLAQIEVIGALTHGLNNERLAEMYALREAGCIAVSNAGRTIRSSEIMRRTMEYAATFGLTVMTSCEDPWLSAGRHAHASASAFVAGLDPIPVAAETIIVSRDLLLAEQTGARVHICRLSTRRSVQMVQRAQFDGLPVTADVAAHQLFLTEADLAGFDTYCHVRPPLRSADDLAALRAGVRDGVLSTITSDHQPHDLDAKMNPFTETEPGISGLDTLLPLVLKLAQEEQLSLSHAVAALTSGPAAVAGLDRGHLGIGAKADVCIFDPEATRNMDANSWWSKGKNSPFLGRDMAGVVRLTMVNGEILYRAQGAEKNA